MPGIFGIISNTATSTLTAQAEAMRDVMTHESFYTSGTFVEPHAELAAGWVALPKSFSTHMPAYNEKKDIILLFAGEVFTRPSDLTDLRSKGHSIDANDARHIVHLYEEFGVAFVGRLNGWFAGLIIDLRQKKIILFNDRYGFHRIYFHERPTGFYFSSEAKSILRIIPSLKRLDITAYSEVLACGCALQNRTLFEDVSLLPPGSIWTFEPHKEPRKETYFKRDTWNALEPLSPDLYFEKLTAVFREVLPRYLNDERPMALSLTGGLDSRMVIAHATPGRLPCYTFGGLYRENTDVKYGRRVAKTANQAHQIIHLDETFFSRFPELARRCVTITDGGLDVTGAAGVFVNEIARSIAPIRITGNYGGEILRGLVMLRASKFRTQFVNEDLQLQIQDARQRLEGELQSAKRAFVPFAQLPWHHYPRMYLEQSQLTLRSPFVDNELVALSFQAPANYNLQREACYQLIKDGNPALVDIPTDRGVVPNPRLADRLREFFGENSFKAEYVWDYGMPHWLARIDKRLSALHFEKLFRGRHKYYHYRLWYREELREYVRDTLLDPQTLSRPYLDRRRVESIVKSHLEGTRNYTLEISSLLTYELIHRYLLA